MLPLDDVRGQEMPQIGQKWPKFGFFARGRQTQGGNSLQCINEMCERIRRFEFAVTEWFPMTTSPSILRNNDFFSLVDISFEKLFRKAIYEYQEPERGCASNYFSNCFHLVSLTDYEIKVAEHIFFHKKGLFSEYLKNVSVVNSALRDPINKIWKVGPYW